MGSNFARDLSESVAMNQLRLRNALIYHLRGNHYPPVPLSMVDPCIRAIKYAKKGLWNKHVRLPKDVSFRGKRTAPVGDVIEAHHLEFFLE